MAEFDRAQLRQWAVRGAEQRAPGDRHRSRGDPSGVSRAAGSRCAGSGGCHGGDCGEGPAAGARKHVCGSAQGGQRANAKVLGGASREHRRRDIRRQREVGGSETGKGRGGKAHARSAEDVGRGTQADQRRTKKALGRATPRQRLSTCGRLSHHGQPPCIPASPPFSSAPVAAALPQSCHKISRMPVEVLDHNGGASGAAHFDHRSRLQRARHRGRRDRSAADHRAPGGARNHRGQRRIERRHARGAGRPPRECPPAHRPRRAESRQGPRHPPWAELGAWRRSLPSRTPISSSIPRNWRCSSHRCSPVRPTWFTGRASSPALRTRRGSP